MSARDPKEHMKAASVKSHGKGGKSSHKFGKSMSAATPVASCYEDGAAVDPDQPCSMCCSGHCDEAMVHENDRKCTVFVAGRSPLSLSSPSTFVALTAASPSANPSLP